jgi:hypothetical protein
MNFEEQMHLSRLLGLAPLEQVYLVLPPNRGFQIQPWNISTAQGLWLMLTNQGKFCRVVTRAYHPNGEPITGYHTVVVDYTPTTDKLTQISNTNALTPLLMALSFLARGL